MGNIYNDSVHIFLPAGESFEWKLFSWIHEFEDLVYMLVTLWEIMEFWGCGALWEEVIEGRIWSLSSHPKQFTHFLCSVRTCWNTLPQLWRVLLESIGKIKFLFYKLFLTIIFYHSCAVYDLIENVEQTKANSVNSQIMP